jgi:hypothetical protein
MKKNYKLQNTNIRKQNTTVKKSTNEKFLWGSRGQFFQKEPLGRRRQSLGGENARGY